MNKFSLSRMVTGIENGIVTISGPALAVSGILAGIDLLTGGHLLAQVSWLTYAWAITLMLTLDFTVLILGVHARRAYAQSANGWKKLAEIALAVLVAAAISFVSIQMQSIIARVNAESISIDRAAAQLGISMIELTWERSTLVLFLIFMSGFLRDEGKAQRVGHSPAPALQGVTIVPQAPASLQIQAPVNAPESDGKNSKQPVYIGQFASKESTIADLLRENPQLTVEQVAEQAGCHVRTAAKWMQRLQEEQA